jgi:hypothetical protein
MKFKLIKEPTEELFNIFKAYFLKSKPFDFCELPSMQMKIFKIKEYFDNLFNFCDCFIVSEEDEIVGFIACEKQKDIGVIVIAIGLHFKITFKQISQYFADFRKFYKEQNPQIKIFIGEIYRTHKPDSYLKFIKRYMKPSKIDLDGERIMVYFD